MAPASKDRTRRPRRRWLQVGSSAIWLLFAVQSALGLGFRSHVQGRLSTGPGDLHLSSTVQDLGAHDFIAGLRIGDELIRSKPLLDSTQLATGLLSGYYVSQVGGVAFDQVAQPAADLRLDDIQLRYVPRNPDGRRLVVFINGRRYRARLPDWQLIPIARYADSPYFAAVTLFGELERDHNRPPQADYVVGYHPAFLDTLLGLRIFQADFFLLDPNLTGELPRSGKDYVLGRGEVRPDLRTWKGPAESLNRILVAGPPFRSYVICDQGVPITFDVRERELMVQGFPYFFFWNVGNARVETFRQGNELVQVLNSFEVVHLDSMSRQLSSRSELLHAVNPAVYEALTVTMRYAAFFRYVKNSAPETWRQFIDSIADLDSARSVATPVLVISRDQQLKRQAHEH